MQPNVFFLNARKHIAVSQITADRNQPSCSVWMCFRGLGPSRRRYWSVMHDILFPLVMCVAVSVTEWFAGVCFLCLFFTLLHIPGLYTPVKHTFKIQSILSALCDWQAASLLALRAGLNKHNNLQTEFLLEITASVCAAERLRMCIYACSVCTLLPARECVCAWRVCVATVCACVSIIAPSPTASPGSWQLDNSFLLFQSRAPERTNMIINHYSNRKVRRGAQDSKRAW